MNALVLEGNGRISCCDIPAPRKTEPSQAVVGVYGAGVCGSDLPRIFDNGAYHYPLVAGHEISGVIEEPPDGSAWRQGDRVVVFPLIPCRVCTACSTGDYAQCANYDYLGSRSDGGFAEYVCAPEANLFAVPDRVSLLHAAMTEPCAVALHAVRKVTIRPGAAAAVFGAGPIGMLAAQWLRIRGCRTVFVTDVDGRKLDVVGEMGFLAVNAADSDAVDQIKDRTGGAGVEISVEACGLPETYAQTLAAAARGGQVVLMGNLKGTLKLEAADLSSILRREITIFGTWNSKVVPPGHDDWSTSLTFLDSEVQVAPLISHTPPLCRGADILARMWNREEYFDKVIFTCGASGGGAGGGGAGGGGAARKV